MATKKNLGIGAAVVAAGAATAGCAHSPAVSIISAAKEKMFSH